jgi:F1F0 ATPase subunit 2
MDASPGGEVMMTDSGLGFAVQMVGGLIVGFMVGVAYFASLWWNTQLFAAGSLGKAIALQLGRIAVAVAVLIFLARLSLVTLLFGALGLLLARPFVLRRFGGL